MGIFKTDKTFTRTDSQNLFNEHDYQKQQSKSKRTAMLNYIQDVGGRAVWEHDLDFVDYISKGNDAGYASLWDKAYRFSLTDGYDQIGKVQNTKPHASDGYYPFIYIKGNGVANKARKEQTEAMCRVLNLEHGELVEKLKNAYGAEWENVRIAVLGLAVELPDKDVIEKGSAGKGKIAYLHRYFEKLIQVRYERKDRTNPDTKNQKAEDWVHSLYFNQINVFEHITEGVNNGLHLEYLSWGLSRGDYWLHWENSDLEYIYEGERFKEKSKKVHICHLDEFGIQRYYTILVEYRKVRFRSDGERTTGNLASIPSGDYVDAWLIPNIFKDDENKTDKMVLPIDRSLIKDYNPKEKSDFLRQNLYVHHMWQKTVEVWRGWVQPVITIGAFIAATIITVKSLGTGATAGSALIKLATAAAVGIVVDKLIDHAVSIGVISAGTASVIRIVVATVTMAYGAGWDFSKILTAPNIMKIVNVSFDEYNKLKQREIQQLSQQMNEHNAMHAKRVYDLQQKQKLHMNEFSADAYLYLNTSSYVPKVDLFETPQMMYARHNNYNVVGISQGLINNLSQGLYTGKVRLYEIQDSSIDLEDMLIIS